MLDASPNARRSWSRSSDVDFSNETEAGASRRNAKRQVFREHHTRGQRAKDVYGYQNARLQDADLHELEHKFGGY